MRLINSLILLVSLTVTLAELYDRPVVKTNYGLIRGHTMESYRGRKFYAFNGIPYAKPPVGDLRFKAPVSPSKYDGILDGSKDAEDCFQVDMKYNQYPLKSQDDTNKYVGQEDCLYLNVYTPRLNEESLPVMVFIHGGAFKIGSGAAELQGPELFLDKDIVLVTINYRLDLLGFLRADDVFLPGNLGLKDQSAALRWVKENIHNFGGNQYSITIFGESAGGASVNLQMLAPRNKGVFQRAISQSGFVHCPWAIQNKAKAEEYAQVLATTLGCSNKPQQMLSCLQEKSVLEIYQAYSTFESELPLYMIFKPVIENEVPGAFITQRALEAGSDIPWIIGINSAEGLLFLEERFLLGDTDLSVLNEKYLDLLSTMLYLDKCPKAHEVVKQIKKFYLGNNQFNMDNKREVVELFSDAFFNYGFYEAGKTHKGKVYKYLFSHIGERTFAFNSRQSDIGADHGEELFLQFYSAHYYTPANLNQADLDVSERLITLWTNFAKFGNPTPEGSQLIWPEANSSDQYVDISTTGLYVNSNLYQDRFEFWENLSKSYRKSIIKDEL